MGFRRKYPLDEFWKLAMDKKVNVIIGSDCHSNGLLWDEAVESTYNLISKYKLNQIKNNIIIDL